MNIDKWFDLASDASEIRISDSVKAAVKELGANAENSSASIIEAGIVSGMACIYDEIKNITNELARLKLGICKIYKIERNCHTLTEKWACKVIEKCENAAETKLKELDNDSLQSINTLVNGRKKDIQAATVLFIEVQKQIFWDGCSKILSDTIKIALTAVLGGIAGGLLVNLFF